MPPGRADCTLDQVLYKRLFVYFCKPDNKESLSCPTCPHWPVTTVVIPNASPCRSRFEISFAKGAGLHPAPTKETTCANLRLGSFYPLLCCWLSVTDRRFHSAHLTVGPARFVDA